MRLVVHAGDPTGSRVRFSVLRRQYGQGSPFATVGSGFENDCFTAMSATIDLASKADGSVQTGTRDLGEVANGTVVKPHSKGPLTRVLGCNEST